MVSVEVFEFSAAVKLRVLGLKDAVAPAGRVLVMLRLAEKLPDAPAFRFTVTR
jgi:hypothetical protein